MVGKLRMARAVADDLGNEDFVIIARTDGLSAVDAPEPARGMELAIDRACATSTRACRTWSGASSRRPIGPVEEWATAVRKRFPDARFAFNWSSSFKWFNDPESDRPSPSWASMGFKFIFITLGGQHAMGHGLQQLLTAMAERQEQGYIELQRREWDETARTSRRAATTSSAACPTTTWSARCTTRRGWAASSWRTLPEDKVVWQRSAGHAHRAGPARACSSGPQADCAGRSESGRPLNEQGPTARLE